MVVRLLTGMERMFSELRVGWSHNGGAQVNALPSFYALPTSICFEISAEGSS